MKNIHVIPTDKPSRLYKRNDLKTYYLGDFDNCNPNDNLRTNQNIYITSDKEIKFNDYITDGYKVWQWKDDSSLLGRKKVILSTDQDLIKDGVQAIDDEFLEWFVSKANDSGKPIDIVEVRKEKYSERFDNDKSPIGNPDTWGNRWVLVFPKEEQKQTLIDMMKDDEKLGLYEETEHLLSTEANKERLLEDIFNDEKRERVKRVINQHKVLKGLTLINPLHLKMTESGYGEFPDSYKLTEKGIQYIIEKLNKE